MAPPEPDHYAILELTRAATLIEIRTAYRRLAREHHPDANPAAEAETRMRRLNEAWETLRDPEKRALYDRQFTVARMVVRTVRRQPPPRPAAKPREDPRWFETEDAPREASRPNVEYAGDPTVNWYREIGVREDAPRQEILKALSKMAGTLNGADVTATEFARRRAVMKEAWAVLGDQYMRAAYDRARRTGAAKPHAAAEPQASSPGVQEPVSPRPAPPPGHRVGPVTVNNMTVDKGAKLGSVDLRAADLRGFDLADINLEGSRLQGVDFEAASLRRANLRGADLSGANLRYADLSHADLTGAVLRQADLAGAALHATNFFRANLTGAGLAGAVGPGVNLDFAELARADFTGANITLQLIERGQLDGTILPDGTKSA
jgi:uncharacterized protein YjbI with pentapeptide repeats